MFGQRDTASLLDIRIVKVPMETLRQRLAHIPYIANYPWLTNQSVFIRTFSFTHFCTYFNTIGLL